MLQRQSAGPTLSLPAPLLQRHATLLKKHARIPNYDALTGACQQPLPLVIEGWNCLTRGMYNLTMR
ncbi:MAG: hypothetical protein H6668_19855 [Ardenticatenaceae bacterium]|nr:hypothetical protein [Ardenticatenaceae bacterium]